LGSTLLGRLCLFHQLDAVARCVYRFADTYEVVLGEIGYQKAVYETLASVPALATSG